MLNSSTPPTPTPVSSSASAELPTAAGTPDGDRRYNWIYKRLVTDMGGVTGPYAYSLYKEEKIAFFDNFFKKYKRMPNDDEMEAFHVNTCTEQHIDGLMRRAELIVADFLNRTLAEQLAEIEAQVRDEFIIEQLKGIRTEMEAKRKVWGWVRDVGNNLATNIGTIAFIGVLVLGYQYLDKVNKGTESAVNMPQSNSPAAAPAQDKAQNTPGTPAPATGG